MGVLARGHEGGDRVEEGGWKAEKWRREKRCLKEDVRRMKGGENVGEWNEVEFKNEEEKLKRNKGVQGKGHEGKEEGGGLVTEGKRMKEESGEKEEKYRREGVRKRRRK